MRIRQSTRSLPIFGCAIFLFGFVWVGAFRQARKPELRFEGVTDGMFQFSVTNGTPDVFAVNPIEGTQMARPLFPLMPHSSMQLGIVRLASGSNRTVGFWFTPAENPFLTRVRLKWTSSEVAKWLPWQPRFPKLGFQPLENGFAVWSDTSGGDRKPMTVGSNIPELQMLRIPGSTAEHLNDYSGKVVVLQFWTIWSPRSQTAITAVQALASQHPEWNKSVRFLSVNIDGECFQGDPIKGLRLVGSYRRCMAQFTGLKSEP